MGKAHSHRLPVRFDPPGHDGYVGTYPAWPRHGDSRGIWTFPTGRRQNVGLRLDGEKLCQFVLLEQSAASLGRFGQGHARLGGPTRVFRNFERMQRRGTWLVLWGAAACTHPGARLRDRSRPLQLRYFLRPSPWTLSSHLRQRLAA